MNAFNLAIRNNWSIASKALLGLILEVFFHIKRIRLGNI